MAISNPSLKEISQSVQETVYGCLFAVLMCGLLATGLAFGWKWFGVIWGTVAGILFYTAVGVLLIFPVNYFRDKWAKEVVNNSEALTEPD